MIYFVYWLRDLTQAKEKSPNREVLFCITYIKGHRVVEFVYSTESVVQHLSLLLDKKIF